MLSCSPTDWPPAAAKARAKRCGFIGRKCQCCHRADCSGLLCSTKAIRHFGLEHSLGFWFVEPMTYFASPYQMNPFNYNPLRDMLAETIDFERVRAQTALKLFIAATNVETAKVKIFTGKELGVEHVLASTCLPLLMQAVEVDGAYYWDGSFSGNPAIYPLVYDATRPISSWFISHPPSVPGCPRPRRRS